MHMHSSTRRPTKEGPRTMRQRWLLSLFLLLFVTITETALAQSVVPLPGQATTGYELAIQGSMTTELGRDLRLTGLAFEVQGLVYPDDVGEDADPLEIAEGESAEIVPGAGPHGDTAASASTP